MNMEENSLSHIHLVKDDLVGYHDWRGKLDLFNIVMIGLAKKLPKHGEQYELHRLLGALFAEGLTAGERLNIIKEEYDIPIEQTIRAGGGCDVQSESGNKGSGNRRRAK